MSRDSYYQQLYKCDNGHVTKHYIWSSQLKKAKHKCTCGEKLTVKHLHEEEVNEAPMIKTPTMNRPAIFADRKKRSDAHFRKEIYPTIPTEDRKHFAKKHNLKT